MLTLCGFPVFSYYNKVKLVLLEKVMLFMAGRPTAQRLVAERKAAQS